LTWELLALAKEFGIERLGFLTLTFADLVLELKEANRRFHSLNTGVIKGRYCRAVKVPERQRSRRLHFHLVVVLASDIRTGFDFGPMQQWAREHPGERPPKSVYASANPVLRAEWAFWRKTAPEYGFGRTELLPVKSCAEALARYVGGYIGKNVRERADGDKGARLVSYIGFGKSGRKGSCRFGWATDNGWLWRHKLAAFAARNGAQSTDDLAKLYGPRWAYFLQAQILAERIDEVYPSRELAERSFAMSACAEGVKEVARDQYQTAHPSARLVPLTAKVMPEDSDPVWAVPSWADNFATHTPAQATPESEERAREMNLYAMRLEPWKPSNPTI
jgi:hypothetical protein